MNRNTNPTIVAIDLGKYKSVVCVLDQASGEYRFTTLDTSRAELRQLLAKEQPGVVVIEACLLAGWVSVICKCSNSLIRNPHAYAVVSNIRSCPGCAVASNCATSSTSSTTGNLFGFLP